MRLLLVLGVAACAGPAFPIGDTTFACDAEHACPGGYTCDVDPGVCRPLAARGCAGQTFTRSWNFDLSDEHWGFTATDFDHLATTMTWVAEPGDPDPGALALEIAVTNGGSNTFHYYAGPPTITADLSHATISTRVWTSTPGVTFATYAKNAAAGWLQTEMAGIADNAWTCQILDVAGRVATGGFDASAIVEIGYVIDGPVEPGTPVRVLFDDVGY